MADADDLLDYDNESDQEYLDPSIDEEQLLKEEEEGSSNIVDVNHTVEDQDLDYEVERPHDEIQNEVNGEASTEDQEVAQPVQKIRDTIPAAYTEDVAPLESIPNKRRFQRGGHQQGHRRGGAVRGAFGQNGRGRSHLIPSLRSLRAPGFRQQRPVMGRNGALPPRPLMHQPMVDRPGFEQRFPPSHGERFPVGHPPQPHFPARGPLQARPPHLAPPQGPPPPRLEDMAQRRPMQQEFHSPQRLPPHLPQGLPPNQPPPGGLGSLPQKVLINKDFRGGIIAPRNPPPVLQPSAGPRIDISAPPPLNLPPPSTRTVPPPPHPEPFHFPAPPPRLDFSRPPPILGMTVTIRNEAAESPWKNQPPPLQERAHLPVLSREHSFYDSQFERERPLYWTSDHPVQPLGRTQSFENVNFTRTFDSEREGFDDGRMSWDDEELSRRPVQDRLGPREQKEHGSVKNTGTVDLREKLSQKRKLAGPTQSNLHPVQIETEESLKQRRIAEELRLGDDYLSKLKQQEELRKQIMEKKAKGIKVSATSLQGHKESPLVVVQQQRTLASTSTSKDEANMASRTPTSLNFRASHGSLPHKANNQSLKRTSEASSLSAVPVKKTKTKWRVMKDKEGNVLMRIRLDDDGNEVETIKFINGVAQPSVLSEPSNKPRSKKVKITGINGLTPDDVIEDACKHFGEVRACLIFREPGQLVEAEVTFEKEESAARFFSNFNKKKLDRNIVTVSFA